MRQADAMRPRGYSLGQIVLHWLGAILVIASFVTHDGMIAAAKAVQQGAYTGADGLIVTHVTDGIVVFVLAVWGLDLLSRRGLPKPGDHACGPREAFVIGREFAHVHPSYDGSSHLMLPLEAVDELFAKGLRRATFKSMTGEYQ